jgi:ABC-type antimicrobial peptide transport system ATPase subunit
MIFQEPMTALDPVYTIGAQIAETVTRHRGGSRSAGRARALELLELVKIPEAERRLDNYPHELSGGLRQRAMIAMALSCGPRLLLADEPTTALDATVQIQVLILLRRLQRELGMGTIFVTHDLGVASEIADRIAVMYAGRIVEEGRSPMCCMRRCIPTRRACWPPPCTGRAVTRTSRLSQAARPICAVCRPAARSRPVAPRCNPSVVPLYPNRGGRRRREWRAACTSWMQRWWQRSERRGHDREGPSHAAGAHQGGHCVVGIHPRRRRAAVWLISEARGLDAAQRGKK